MDPMTIMALLSLAQGAMGAGQKMESAALRRRAARNFQPYEVPPAAKAMLGKAQSLASLRGVPGEDIYRQNAMDSVASGVEVAQRTAQAPSDVLAVLQKLHGGYADFEKNLAVAGSQAHEQRQRGLMDSLMRFSQFETDRWRYNELYPYMQSLNEAGDVGAAGNANIQSAVSSGMGIYGAKMDMDSQSKMFESYKDWLLGPNTGAPFNRTRAGEYQMRQIANNEPLPKSSFDDMLIPILPLDH
jgi:hypothetical protein